MCFVAASKQTDIPPGPIPVQLCTPPCPQRQQQPTLLSAPTERVHRSKSHSRALLGGKSSSRWRAGKLFFKKSYDGPSIYPLNTALIDWFRVCFFHVSCRMWSQSIRGWSCSIWPTTTYTVCQTRKCVCVFSFSVLFLLGWLTPFKGLLVRGKQPVWCVVFCVFFGNRFFSALELVEELNLSGNKLALLPDAIGRLRQLQVLKLHSNRLRKLPDFSGCVSLRVRITSRKWHANISARRLPSNNW